MLSALLVPAVDLLNRRGAPRGGAVALVLLTGFAMLGGILAFVVSQFVVGLPSLVDQVAHSIDSTRKWLIEGPAHLSRQQIDNAGNAATQALRNNQDKLTSGALSTAATITEIVTAALLDAVHLNFLPLWRPQHLALRHENHPGRRIGSGCALPASPDTGR